MSRILQRLFTGLAVAVVVTTVWSCNRMTTETPRAEGGAIVSVNETLSDGWITTKIQAQFFADPNVKSRSINVDTDNGIVTLSGTVENTASRQRALEIAQNTDGVRRVEDRLTIGRETADTRVASDRDLTTRASNGWITTKIQARYFLDRDVKARNIDVTTANGTVTLSGHVDSERARQRAVEIARNTDGVRRIEDRLQITGTGTIGTGGRDEPKGGREPERSVTGVVADAAITTMIQSKLFLDDEVKGRTIDVDTTNGVVTLSGPVESDAERRQAIAIARSTNGVRDVIDQLKVSAPAPSKGARAGPRNRWREECR